MDLPALLHTYGYVLIFAGTLLEGETLLLLGGLFAHQGYLNLAGVMLTAFVAAVCGDQMFFHIGRHHAKRLLDRFPKLRDRVNLALHRVERHQVKVVLSMRFLWGLRIALPIALGLTTMKRSRYFAFNLISAAVWACTISLLGYGAGRVISRVFADLHRYELWIAGVLVAAAVVALIWHVGRPRRSA